MTSPVFAHRVSAAQAHHEIGFFQGTYGRGAVVLLHEEGVNIPPNLSGVAYVPFPKGNIDAGFHVLQRELKAIYKL
jgi:predicted nucleotide-binding protein